MVCLEAGHNCRLRIENSCDHQNILQYNHSKLQEVDLQRNRVLRCVVFLICVAAMAAAQDAQDAQNATAVEQPAAAPRRYPVPLRYSAGEPIVLRDGAGTATFTVTNPGTVASPLALRIGIFSDDISQLSLSPPKVLLATETNTPLPAYLLPGATVLVVASVSDLNGSVAATATLFNGTMELGRIHAVEPDAPFDVSLTGGGSSGQRLVLTPNDDAVITLKNGDGEAYPVDWVFQVGGRTLQSGELQLAPHGSSSIGLVPTDDLYSWTDNLRPSQRTGSLQLSIHGPPQVPREMFPERTLPVSLLMRKLSPSWTSLWLHLFVALVLLLGGLLSLIGSSALPNILRKINLRRKLDDLAGRTGNVSKRVDSYVRMLLRLERKRVDLLLKRAPSFSLSSADMLDSVSSSIDQLARRLKITERLDDLRRRLDEASITAPPSVTDDIDIKLQMAAGHLQPLTFTDDEATAASRYLDAAETSLGMLSDTDNLAKLTAANFKDLRVRQKLIPQPYYSDLKAALPGLFEMMNQPFDDPRNITRQMMFAIDYGIAALQMAFDYALLKANAPAAGAAVSETVPGAGSTQSIRERLIFHQRELIGLLGTISWPALRELRTLVQEMRENIYESDVLEEIATKGQAEIVFDPRTVRPFVPVVYSIRFRNSRFDDAAALRRLTCKWDFPGHILEQDWKICHFFQGNEIKRSEGRDVTVSVRVESRKAPDAGGASNDKVLVTPLRSMLSATIDLHRPERPSYSRALVEGVRFLIAFGVAFAALLAGALEQLNKLDFVPAMIAVLALGFGADTVKNLLTQTAKRAAS